MEKKNKGLKIALAIIIAIIIGLLVFIVCNAVSKNSSTTQGELKTEQSKEGLEVEYEAEKVPDTELYSAGFQTTTFIINGNLYIVDNRPYHNMDALSTKKIESIKGTVKKVKAYSIGHDPTTTYFAITTEGKVYSLTSADNVKEYELFSNYTVEDIISIQGNEYEGCEYKILLKDGRKIQINTVRNESTNNQQQVTTKEIQ